MKDIQTLIRPELRDLKPYSSARDEFEGEASVFLDANENPFDNGVNRYPDPLQKKLKQRIAELKGVSVDSMFLGNGSDECIDLLFRLFCVPGKDSVVAISPSYGMYAVSAKINQVEVKDVLLDSDFSLPVERLLAASVSSKMIFICSPNNPTGNAFYIEDIIRVATGFDGIVVVDEAYIDFSSIPSMVSWLHKLPNVVISQTLSKAYGMAGIRLGILMGSSEIISWINKVKPPYNINCLTQEFALKQLENSAQIQEQITVLLTERTHLIRQLQEISAIQQVFPSDANFVLIRIPNATEIYSFLTSVGIVVRNRSNQPLCENTLRLTVGTPEENRKLIEALKNYTK